MWKLKILVGYTQLETEQILTCDRNLRPIVQLKRLLYRRWWGGKVENTYVDKMIKDKWPKITLTSRPTK
jgi:hypothetical protein